MDKPFIGVANSYVGIVPGHVHLQALGKVVRDAVWEAGGVPFEFNTIGVDDGIAMGHLGMKYSLPSRELIADSVEFKRNAAGFPHGTATARIVKSSAAIHRGDRFEYVASSP